MFTIKSNEKALILFQQEGTEEDLANDRTGDRSNADQQRSEWPTDDTGADSTNDEPSSDQDGRGVRQSRSADKLSSEPQNQCQPDADKEVKEDTEKEEFEDGEELKQSTDGEQNASGTIQKFKFDEVEEFFVDLIERSDDEQVAE